MTSNLCRNLLFLALAALVATGCSKSAKRDKFLKLADAQFQAGDYDRAEIAYLNLLRLDPTNHTAISRLGLMSFEQGRTLRAYALLSEAKQLAPEDLEVRRKLAMVLLAGGKPKEAREEALLLFSRQPTNPEIALFLVDSSLTTNDVADARQRVASLKSVNGGLLAYHLADGSLRFRERDIAGAETASREALALDPKSSLVHAVLGNLLLIRKDLTNAELELKTAAELSPPRSSHRLSYVDFKAASGDLPAAKDLLAGILKSAPDYLPASLRVAQFALAEERFPDCEAALKGILQRDPSHLEGTLLLARLRIAQKQPAKAVPDLERLLKIYPKLPQAHYQLALIRLAQDDLPGALKSLNETLDLQPGLLEPTLLLAELNLRRGDTAAAVNSLSQVVARRPDLTQAQLLLATAYRAQGKPEPALKIYDQLSRMFPTNPQPAFLTGLVLAQQNRRAEARQSYEKVLAMTPTFIPAVEQLVNLDLAGKQYDAAVQRAQQFVARYPTNAGPYLLLAQVHFALTNFPAAEADLAKSLELAPHYPPANALLARVYVASRQLPAALKKLNEMVARNTNDLMSWMMIAELHSAATNHAAAKSAYESILAANPRHGPALNNLAWLCSEELNEPARAYELASRARELLPRDPATADTFGWVLYHNGDYARALALVQEAARRLPEQPEIQFHLGLTHYAMGEEAAARVALQTAVQLAPVGASWKPRAEVALHVLDFNPATADSAARTELESLAARSPRDPIVLARLAAFAAHQGDSAKAAAGYEKSLLINSNLVPVMVQLAKLYSVQPKDPARAFLLARRARSLEPADPEIAHTLGRLAYDSAQSAADFQWAYGLLQEAARSAPDDVEWQFDLALGAYANGDVPAAVAAMKKVVAANPASPRQTAAARFLDLNQLAANPAAATAAAARVADLLAKQPDDVAALLVSGIIEEARGNFAGARDTLEKILKRFPLFSPANKALARIYASHLKDPQKAYDFASRAREALPNDLEVARILGGLAFLRAEYPRAVQLLTECAPASPQDADLFFTLGLAHHKLKQPLESKTALAKALALAPSAPQAAEARKILAELK